MDLSIFRRRSAMAAAIGRVGVVALRAAGPAVAARAVGDCDRGDPHGSRPPPGPADVCHGAPARAVHGAARGRRVDAGVSLRRCAAQGPPTRLLGLDGAAGAPRGLLATSRRAALAASAVLAVALVAGQGFSGLSPLRPPIGPLRERVSRPACCSLPSGTPPVALSADHRFASAEQGNSMKVVLFCGASGRGSATTPIRFRSRWCDRLPADHVAPDALLRPFRTHRVHPLPGLSGRRHQGVFPPVQRSDLQRFHLLGGWPEDRAAPEGYRELEDHLRGHGPALEHRERLRRVRKYVEKDEVFLPTTPTACPTWT